MGDDPDGAAAAVHMAGGVRVLTGRLVAMLVPDEQDRSGFGPRRNCATALRTAIEEPRDAFAWGEAVAYARSADLVHTVEAIRLLAADAGAVAGVGRWMGDTEAAIERACGHETVEQLAGIQVGYLMGRGVDERRARYWLTAQDPLLGYLSPLDMLRAGHPKTVEMARMLLIATLPDL